MKKIALMFLLSSLTAGVAMAESAYIPWTFDDFDDNCNVIDNAPVNPAAVMGSLEVKVEEENS